VDLRAPLRQADGEKALDGAIDLAMARKPKVHDVIIDRRGLAPALTRYMSTRVAERRAMSS
jgi:cyclic pyranopterin phosphate synthase